MSRRQRRVYSSLDEAVAKYLSNNRYMKEESARILVSRGTREVEIFESRQTDDVADSKNREKSKPVAKIGYVFKHDQRLVGLTSMRYTDEDALEFCRAITCPVLLFLAVNPIREKEYTNRSPFIRWLMREYAKRVEAVKDIHVSWVHGSHHLHLDQAVDIFPTISQFITDDTKLEKMEKLDFPDPALIKAKL